MKKEIKLKGKYQVQWRGHDEKGYYDTFIIAQSKEEARVYAENARVKGQFPIKIVEL